MAFKPSVWYPVALVLSAVNIVAAVFAARPDEPWHVTIHVVLALGFGWWAGRLRRGELSAALRSRLEALEGEASRLRQELTETQERVDFAERVLAQQRQERRVGP